MRIRRTHINYESMGFHGNLVIFVECFMTQLKGPARSSQTSAGEIIPQFFALLASLSFQFKWLLYALEYATIRLLIAAHLCPKKR